ncbi:MAG TPA: hypothetical protein VF637_13050 [Sphingomicrobium sp.]|jgi:hypothetical protein
MEPEPELEWERARVLAPVQAMGSALAPVVALVWATELASASLVWGASVLEIPTAKI